MNMGKWRIEMMKHNYRLADFKRMGGESDTDIRDIHVFMELGNLSELPAVIETRLENMANNLIAEHEQKTNTTLVLDDMELGASVEIRKESGELAINVYIGYSIEFDCLCGEDVIKREEKDYMYIRKFFFDMLNDYVLAEIKIIEDCLR